MSFSSSWHSDLDEVSFWTHSINFLWILLQILLVFEIVLGFELVPKMLLITLRAILEPKPNPNPSTSVDKNLPELVGLGVGVGTGGGIY